ncbi:hypothetical protein BDE02_10G013900 [Populus trichocarpa]|uniref:FLZ-type domain-containing protein n=1 Tax=Populus trichocarpa x Populus deltoides TaxID=3695 RepID=A9PIQ4_9ROSI|nr:unknown [Populus trichocarpa x Populus deltoides]KAI5572438.1 hypothetical protein BDE02_10G013900 [Populus trichocarpa]
MVGLSIVLETPKSGSALQVINKVTLMINNKPTSPPSFSSSRNHSPRFSFPVPTFLDQCFFCGQKLLPGKDIYMYKGDRGFCSVECRCRQIFLDEEETLRKENCSFAAMKPTGASASASAKSTSSTAASRHRKGTRNREGGFAY